MTVAQFRRIALSMPQATEASHMNHPDFRANGKIFATIHHDHESGMVKLKPEQQQRFVGDDPKSFTPESGAWGRAGCTKVIFRAVDEETLGEAMTLAWQNTGKTKPGKKSVAPKRKSS